MAGSFFIMGNCVPVRQIATGEPRCISTEAPFAGQETGFPADTGGGARVLRDPGRQVLLDRRIRGQRLCRPEDARYMQAL